MTVFAAACRRDGTTSATIDAVDAAHPAFLDHEACVTVRPPPALIRRRHSVAREMPRARFLVS